MTYFPLRSFIVSAFCLGSTLGGSNNDSLANEVADLKRTVIQLTADMLEMKKLSKALNNLCAELHLPRSLPDPDVKGKEQDMNTGDGHTLANHGEATAEQQMPRPFEMHSIEVINDTFKIEYDANIYGETFFALLEPNATGDFGKLSSAENGIITGPMATGLSYVSIMSGEFGASLSFKSNTTSAKIDLEPLKLNTSVRGSVIFEKGRSKEVKITFLKNRFDSIQKDIGMYTQSDDGTVLLSFLNSPDIVKTSDKEEDPALTEISFSVNRNKDDQEGLLYMSLSSGFSESKNIDYIYTVSQVLDVRRADHPEPFKVGYIGFVKHVYIDFDVTCTVGTSCALSATLVGNRPVGISLWKVIDGEILLQEVPENRGEFGRYALGVTFYLQIDSIEDEGRFMYRGISHSGNMIQKEFNVTVFDLSA